jgi:hypothetical protein
MRVGDSRLRGWFPVTVAALVICGCLTRGQERPVPLPPGASPSDIIDRDDPAESLNPLTADELTRAAEAIRQSRKPKRPPDKTYNILCLSGGGVYGAFSSGVLVGWTDTGKRPNFDVVTGISAGAHPRTSDDVRLEGCLRVPPHDSLALLNLPGEQSSVAASR